MALKLWIRTLTTTRQRRSLPFKLTNVVKDKESGIGIGIGTNIMNTMREFENEKPLDDNTHFLSQKSMGTANPVLYNSEEILEDNLTSKGNSNSASSESENGLIARRSSLLHPEEVIRMEAFFDTYKVYQQFKNSGFTEEQSLALMKYTYFILEDKLTWLHQAYSPKVDLENEDYLFKAAHSELLVEITNSREISLMNLTNAMIILRRAFTNLEDETSAQIKLNDDMIKMEINQFKHENNLHQKTLNLKNSDLNSRIISELVSGLKSEIEFFRWELTRAGILSIMVMAICIMGTWSLTNKSAPLEEEDYKGPILVPLHEATDEESHDYEADWDDRVNVQIRR
ncbi:Put7 protein [Martiniozyma asiatica (nom. inval.)]|nr:Put7 protein [Martiniozyma asiatica]